MSEEITKRSHELASVLGLDVLSALFEVTDNTILADCRAGLSSPDTDFADQMPASLQSVYCVACGRRDQVTLCAILFRRAAALAHCQQSNPKLRTALVTQLPGVKILWLQVTGSVPRNNNLGVVTWCSKGMVPVGAPNVPIQSFIAAAGNVPLVDFRELKWPELEQDALDIDLLEQEVGPRFQKRSKQAVLNLDFWSRLLVKKFRLNYDPSAQKFQVRPGPGEPAVCLSESGLIDAVLRCLEKLSRQLEGFPPRECRFSRARELVRRLKGALTRDQPSDDEEVVARFVNEEVEAAPGELITSQQLWASFLIFCRTRGLPLCTQNSFFSLVREMIRERIGVGHSHDRIRGRSDNPRFYRNVTVKSPLAVVVQLVDAARTQIRSYGEYSQPPALLSCAR